MDIAQIYKNANALLEGHFLLSSGRHSPFYLQSAKVLENPKVAENLAYELASLIRKSGIKVDCICSPALGGILAGYELARTLGVRFIFTERVEGAMALRRGFEVKPKERVIVCEDIITTGGSAMESAGVIKALGAEIVGFAALANRGICNRFNAPKNTEAPDCKLDVSLPLFALEDFIFETYEAKDCPLCKQGSQAIKPGSRGN
ncbi:orotate phosphoribosyltransferase [Helicobacter winghamensis]|uniref:Orotate phosphoribosyltransferase n=1 Tax=Helicobacter winghamensis TaxID=157268 RepID=A0A2N3PIK0_9HELI|nr:orotate phosphoribosyltransferase [Helicobacter winghamensis]EEO25621.1 orotate phosphoribosyltransferase [Helicobacter winghamensis ATCC BAA-430]PKT76112.1 orotate phosphoribosyltransferase [Helicobacter winghamensis]PKT76747.1 orotate phosphoribosyltransferase [Helicobacter winghamensis]PKT76868.1 orotate phosphoribosyltransferase [Helicobacter winghamensis]PKT80623.1 orotate phosphoribosyltransferase [Helicobacter winghamensis]